MSLKKDNSELLVCKIHTDLKLRLKVAATEKRLTMTAFIIELIEEKLTTTKK